jgi:pyrroloquinoline quinone (PQQ) biosynthesis protein C/mannose-6-phosphate isomerase-like protein (cupin superfamily)
MAMMQSSASSFERSALTNPLPALGAASSRAPRPHADASVSSALAALQALRDRHAFWDSPLLTACAQGSLSRDDFKFIFSQYYGYSRNFTRYLAAAMANCGDDYYRSRLTENLWEESGEKDIERRHAQIFRRFLREGLDIDTQQIEFLPATESFTREFLDFCLRSHPLASSAFLSLGTEGIVSRMYSVLVEGLLQAGVEERHLEFFRIHIGCDDEHAETLEKMMCSYYHEPDWFNTCARAMDYALGLRQRFFNDLLQALPHHRVKPLISSVQSEEAPGPVERGAYLHGARAAGAPLYHNADPGLNLEFRVERLPFRAEVLDPRVVRIPAGKCNELHKHGHETVIHIMSGRGCIEVDDQVLDATAGDTVFVPRWALHRATNTGAEELSYFAVTDFGFASRVHRGDYLAGHRQKPENDRSFGH